MRSCEGRKEMEDIEEKEFWKVRDRWQDLTVV